MCGPLTCGRRAGRSSSGKTSEQTRGRLHGPEVAHGRKRRRAEPLIGWLAPANAEWLGRLISGGEFGFAGWRASARFWPQIKAANAEWYRALAQRPAARPGQPAHLAAAQAGRPARVSHPKLRQVQPRAAATRSQRAHVNN